MTTTMSSKPRERIEEFEDAARYIVTQQGDNLCWMDVYKRLAHLVDINFDPTLLDDQTMERNCQTFIKSLRSGCPYHTGEYIGHYAIEKILHLGCGHCDKWWSISGGDETTNYFCPYCGHQQHFEGTSST